MHLPGVTGTVRTVLLDIDGTLLESNDAHAHAWVDALGEARFDVPYARLRPLIGMGADQLLPELSLGLSAGAEPGKTIARRRGELFKQFYLHELQPTRGARALLVLLRERGITCVVATSATQSELDELLERAGVADLIAITATADDADASKPAPDIVLAGLAKAHAAAAESVLLGDSPFDIVAARRAGVPTVALRCGGSDDAALAGAAAIYDDPAALAEAIRS